MRDRRPVPAVVARRRLHGHVQHAGLAGQPRPTQQAGAAPGALEQQRLGRGRDLGPRRVAEPVVEVLPGGRHEDDLQRNVARRQGGRRPLTAQRGAVHPAGVRRQRDPGHAVRRRLDDEQRARVGRVGQHPGGLAEPGRQGGHHQALIEGELRWPGSAERRVDRRERQRHRHARARAGRDPHPVAIGAGAEPPWGSRTPDLRITSASYLDGTVRTESIRARQKAHGAHRVPR